jgi:methionine synthase I (cobalamin-dependent)/5,10-methylenetetrahydrofolate reductase
MAASSSKTARPFLDAVRSGVLVVDGAMGTQLYERGVLYSACFEELNASRPELVAKVHEDYLRAGAQVIETNTFGANALRLEKYGLQSRVRELNAAGVKVAREAAAGQAYVVGAIGPSGYFLGAAEPWSSGDLAKVKGAFHEQARALVEAGVDALFVETIRQTPELRAAIEAAVEVSEGRVPVFGSASLDEGGRMAEGTDAEEVARLVKEWGVSGVGVNCSDGPMAVLAAVEKMVPVGLPVLASPNAGLPRRVDERMVYVSTPEYFGVYARRMIRVGARLVGGCCGTTPEHIKWIRNYVRASAPGRRIREHQQAKAQAAAPAAAPRTADEMPAVPLAERSELGRKLAAGEFVCLVEILPPRGSRADKEIAAAQRLKEAGVDAINIPDGPRASARMSNQALAVMMRQQTGIEPVLHYCCRDRNVISMQSDLLGAYALGLRNVILITGDPPKLGNYPNATAVFDVDAIGLTNLVRNLNSGLDFGGNAVGSQTAFAIGVGANPGALNWEEEWRRLQWKIEAGADYIVTQPVFDPELLDRLRAAVGAAGKPVIAGIWPLASLRQAEFMENELRVAVPAALRDRMRRAGNAEEARREGLEIAKEMIARLRQPAGAGMAPVAGVQISVLGRTEAACELIASARAAGTETRAEAAR